MPDYSQGKVYKIASLNAEEGDTYYGSTVETLSRRMSQHRTHYKGWKNGQCNYTSSFLLFDKYGLENCLITLVETVSVTSKEELLQRERFYIENNKCVNKCLPILTGQEKIEYHEKHHEKNRAKILQFYQKIKKFLQRETE